MLLKDCGKKPVIPDVFFYLAVLSGAKRFNSKEFKKLIGAKSIRFATPEEVKRITGCLSGAVPPFGSMFKENVLTKVDKSLE